MGLRKPVEGVVGGKHRKKRRLGKPFSVPPEQPGWRNTACRHVQQIEGDEMTGPLTYSPETVIES